MDDAQKRTPRLKVKAEEKRKRYLLMALFILGVLGLIVGKMAYTGVWYFNSDLLELLLFGVPVAVYLVLRNGFGIDLVDVAKRLTGREEELGPEDE